MTDFGHWIIRESIKEELPYGFVYVIENNLTGRKYIGKKQIQTIRRTIKKGRKNKIKKIVETDWRSYTGSCRELNEDIEKSGKKNFTFEILKWCNSKWELSYWEAKEQFERDVIFREDYYNGILNLRVPKAPAHLRIKR